MSDRLARSYLYVPGNAPERFSKALASGADAVIVDLEDAVPFESKGSARTATAQWLNQAEPGEVELWVRVNSGGLGASDIDSLAEVASLTGIVLAKASAKGTLQVGEEMERRRLPWQLSPLLETPGAVLDARHIAAMPRVSRLQLGEYDLCAEVGIMPGPEESESTWARMQLVFASAEAGIAPPIAPVSVVIKDAPALARSTELARRQGFVGRACIHPSQLAVVHKTFTPNADEVDAARRMLKVFERSRAAIRSARRVLALNPS
jgi:citrate lyase subunit beta/citryl-CoA lyase